MKQAWKSLKRSTQIGIIIFLFFSIAAIAYAAAPLLISKTWKTNIQKGEILSMQLVQTDVKGTVSPG